MRKIFFTCFFIISIHQLFAQQERIDSLLQKLTSEKEDTARFNTLDKFMQVTSESDPLLDLKNLQQIYLYGQKNHDRVIQAYALSRSGYDYRSLGNMEKSLEYNLAAVDMAQETGNLKLQAVTKMNLTYTYKDLSNYTKAISLLADVIALSEKSKYYKAQTWAYGSLTVIYLEMNKTDSALIYGQRCYALCMQIHYYDYLGYRLINLGDVNAKLGNNTVALGYYDMAIQDGLRIKSPKQLNWAFMAKAMFFYNTHQKDSSIDYAIKAVNVVQQTAFSNYSLKPAKLLLEIYKPINSDSALKYSEIYRITNDSLYNAKAFQQTQQMTFENEVKQQKITAEKSRVEEERRQNIQYASIALGIIFFITIFLLLSRTVLVNEKLISFFAILGLLIIFEFINLLIHPWLARVTHESPVLMLLALVIIASLLIPMHHKVEHWTKEKMVEKNKAIRLAAAKKTIEKLEKK